LVSGQPVAWVDQDWKSTGSPPHSRPYFLFVGRLEEIKGLQNLIPEFAGPGAYDLIVVGSGTYERNLREQARNMSRVKFAGWIPQVGLERITRTRSQRWRPR
jgi:glycosyltransferase involved in cell wall biosynthesis